MRSPWQVAGRTALGRTTAARIVGAVLIFASLGFWAVASPVGSSPDEDYHLASIWCAQGIRDGLCEPGATPDERAVPEALSVARCFAFWAEVSAGCQGTAVTTPDGPTMSTERGNFGKYDGDYPPVFFAVLSPLAGDDIEASVIAMRLLNALLFVLMMAGTFVLAAPALRQALLVGVGVTLVPLGIFIVPSVNPSSWAIISAATVVVSIVVHVTAPDKVHLVLSGILAGLGVLIGAGSRGDAALYAVLAVGVALVLTFRADRTWLLRAIYPVVLACLAGLSFLSAGQSASAVGGSAPGKLSLGVVAKLLSEVPELWVGALGSWGLGWVDTSLPALVWVTTSALFAAVLVTGIRGVGRQHGLAIAAAALATWLLPAYIQFQTGASVGSFVQPRYILPLLMIMVLTVLCRPTGERWVGVTQGQRWLAVTGLAVANSLALHANLRRYLTGTDVEGFNLSRNIEWWWSGGVPGPVVVWVAGSVAFACALALLSRDLRVDVAMEAPRAGGSALSTADDPPCPGVLG